MEKATRCPTCGSVPVPRKLERSELYVCECDCGWTCLGNDQEQAIRSWNYAIAAETPYAKPKNTKSKTTRSE